ncbi:hypothetical protein DSO57_1017403 [Entomophthora muscae]|uniref:Uncharacterized protein n=1 Tax=Entomophthora muscae TaxID=34485 RepID=A0ACC2STC5_9FUNG|nr:hypothetical protein DSO57_1017403 [Entomophthora muscae]
MNYYAGKPLPTGSRLEVAAREARYAAMVKAMGHTDSRVLTLGHHGNDLAETFLFRFFRESGVAGLTGMNPLRSIPLSLLDIEGWTNSEALRKLKLFRPMLMVPKTRIYDTCNFYGLKWVEDPTNVCSTSVQQRAVIRAEMKKWEADSSPEKAPLQFKALMNTVTHFAEHNRAINSRILHLVSKEVQFNPTYGICELHVPIRPSPQHWLSNPYLACRILSTLSQWIACSDHAPGLGSVRAAYSAMLGLPSSHIASDKTTTFCLQIGLSMLVSPTKKNPYWAMCRSPFPREKMKVLTFALDLLIPDSGKESSAVKIAPIWKTLWDQRYYIYVAAKCDFRQDKNLLLWAKLFLPGIQSLPLGDDLVQFILQPLNQDLISSLRNKHVVFGRKLPSPLKTSVSDASFKLYNLQKQITVKTVRGTVPVVVMRIHTARLGEFAPSHLVGKMKHKFIDVPIAFPTLKDFTIFPDLFTVRSEHNFPRLTEIFS